MTVFPVSKAAIEGPAAAARRAAGEGEDEAHRPLHQVAVVRLARGPAEKNACLAACDLARQLADDVGVHATDRRGLFRPIVGQAMPQQHERRNDVDLFAGEEHRLLLGHWLGLGSRIL